MSVDINASDFAERFDPNRACVGIIGHGYVGKAMEHFFRGTIQRVAVHDKAKDFASLRDVVSAAEVIFVCVPTPMNPDGSCHTGIVEQVIRDIRDEAVALARNMDSFVIVLKSTVPPGFTKRVCAEYPMLRIIFCPEYLTEANAFQDVENATRVVLGGDRDDCFVVYQYFRAKLLPRLRLPPELGGCSIAVCDSDVAEMAKLYANSILAAKVIFANEVYLLCQKMGVAYDDVRIVTELDKRIGTHLKVPGIGGQLGYGGSCFPKDINDLRNLMKEHQTGEKLLTAVIERNEEVRGNRDWEELKGRAVVE